MKKFQNLKIWPKIPIGNRQVGSRFSKNRPTCCDFEKKILDSQLHQTFKPIRILFCTTCSCSDLSIYLSYNIYKFHENWRTILDSLTHSLTHSLHFTHFTSLTQSRQEKGRRAQKGLCDMTCVTWLWCTWLSLCFFFPGGGGGLFFMVLIRSAL